MGEITYDEVFTGGTLGESHPMIPPVTVTNPRFTFSPNGRVVALVTNDKVIVYKRSGDGGYHLRGEIRCAKPAESS